MSALLTVCPPMPSMRGAKIAASRLKLPLSDYLAQRQAGNLWCSSHQTWEPFGRFYASTSRNGGSVGVCRDGILASNAASQKRRSEKSKAYHRAYRQANLALFRNRDQARYARQKQDATQLPAPDVRAAG